MNLRHRPDPQGEPTLSDLLESPGSGSCDVIAATPDITVFSCSMVRPPQTPARRARRRGRPPRRRARALRTRRAGTSTNRGEACPEKSSS
jgi:hypothetical protein